MSPHLRGVLSALPRFAVAVMEIITKADVFRGDETVEKL